MLKRFLGLVSVGLVVVACSSASDPVAEDDANTTTVNVGGSLGNGFAPAEVTIKAGQKVRWVFGSGVHNVVSGPDSGPTGCPTNDGDGKFNSGLPPTTGTFEHVFSEAGDFPYYCSSHCTQGMKGVVHVTQ